MLSPLILSSAVLLTVLSLLTGVRAWREYKSSRIRTELLSVWTLDFSVLLKIVIVGDFPPEYLALDLCAAGVVLVSAPLSHEDEEFRLYRPVLFSVMNVIMSIAGVYLGLPSTMYSGFIGLNTTTCFIWYFWSRFGPRLMSLKRSIESYNLMYDMENTFRLFLYVLSVMLLVLSPHLSGHVMAFVNLTVYIYLYARSLSGIALFPASMIEKRVRNAAQSGSKKVRMEMERAVDRTLYDRCCDYMAKNKPFLVDSYSIDDLAAALLTNRVYLSKSINYYADKNFCQFINYYRVNYAIELVTRNPRLRVQDMAQLSGFHNMVSFNIAFKMVKGETPGEWRRRTLGGRHEQSSMDSFPG